MKEEISLQKRKERFLILQCKFMKLCAVFWEITSKDETEKNMVKDVGDKFMKLVEEILKPSESSNKIKSRAYCPSPKL